MAALGLLLLAAAVVVALVGFFTNAGSSHALGHSVDLFGYHLNGSTGKLLIVGVIIGAIGMLGLNMLLAGLGRGFKRRVSYRRERRHAERETHAVAVERDELAQRLEREHAARVAAEENRVAAEETAERRRTVQLPAEEHDLIRAEGRGDVNR